MKNSSEWFLVNEAAKQAGVSGETLRHYDRIGLVCPSRKDNGYRYYSSEQVVLINIVKRLQSLGFSLLEVKEAFAFTDLAQVREILEKAQTRCEEKIKELKKTRAIIVKAIAQYSSQKTNEKEITTLTLPDRYILLSKKLKEVNLATLFDYQRHYKQELGDRFASYHFFDQALLYLQEGQEAIGIQCAKPANPEDAIFIPGGRYLSLFTSKETKDQGLAEARKLAESCYGVKPSAALILIRVNGIANWSYEVQLRLSGAIEP